MENIILHLTCCIYKMKRKKEKYQNSKEKKSSLGMSVKLQRSLKNFNGLTHEEVGKSKSLVSTPSMQLSDPPPESRHAFI